LSTKTLIEYVDDLDGSRNAETVRFGLDGREYEIDLNDRHARKFRKAVKPFTTNARAVRRKTGRRTMETRERAIRVRTWARKHGYEVGARGRIPIEVEEAFNAALI
jgi:hypothetical protein